MQQYQGQRQTLEQKRGQEAWRRVNQIKDESKDRKDNGQFEKDYRSRVRSLNSMIQINGLGSTLGFLKAKSNELKIKQDNDPPNAPYRLLEHLTAWMSERNFIPSNNTSNEDADDTEDDADEAEINARDIQKNTSADASEMDFEGYDGILTWLICKATRDDYRRATTECLAFGLWLRRFAEAELQSSLPQASNANASQNTEHESSTNTETNENMQESSIEGAQQNGK